MKSGVEESQSEPLADENSTEQIENSNGVNGNDFNEKVREESSITENKTEEKITDCADTPDGKSDNNALSSDSKCNNASSSANVKVDNATNNGEVVEGELKLYPMAVKGPSGERLELQVNPVDSVMDLRQFLLDAPETCFYTSYDLILIAADGTKHQLADFYEIGDVADVTAGGCSLEMVSALYDDRSIRNHLRRTRDLLSSTNIHSSLSTTLAMENDSKKNSGTGVVKSEAAELDGLGFMEDPCGQLGNLIVPSQSESRCVDKIAFSSFNPVPGYRRLLGDLIYLDVVTLEGKSCSVTGHTRGFFVNASVGLVLDHRSAHPLREATTLVSLLRQLSDKFSKGFTEVLERRSQGHPFENVPSLLPVNPWLAAYPPPAHIRDVGRAEDALTPSYGTETIGMQRDWNEELQSCREFPRTTLQDRIMRDRALYKVNCDFVDAATKGAKGVIGRCIPPINPTDPERFHMYVHNNIFFSFAMDGDFTLMQQLHEKASKKPDDNEVKDSSKSPDGLVEDSKENESSKSVENSARRSPEEVSECPESVEEDKSNAINCDSDSSQEGSASLHAAENEQATYASANNDLKGTKAYNNADIASLYTLAMAIIDYRGHRIVAQSIIPGILQGDKSESLLYGSVDNGKKIFWNDKFHAKVLEAGKLLHIKEHEVLDGSGAVVKMAAPVECKGIIGSDDRHYILDLMRTTPRDANYTGPAFRHAVLRPELVAAFCQAEALSKIKSKINEKDEVVQEELPSICLNPNVLTDFKLAGDPEEIVADEEAVKKAGKYLVDTVLPKFIQDLSSLEVSPMDGQTLTEALHANGINMRYLGKVANLSKHLPHVWDLCVVEMVSRIAKHVLKGILRVTQDHDVAGAIAHFLNCYLGYDLPVASTEKVPDPSVPKISGKPTATEKTRKKSKGGRKAVENSATVSGDNSSVSMGATYLCVTSSLVWKDLHEGVKFKYQFELPEDILTKIRKISSVRNLCQKVGLTLAARAYDFNVAPPFQLTDILDLHAVVKHSVPMCADSRDLLENGKLKLAEGKLNEAYESFSEGFSILQQVCGPMHREVANCCRYLAMVLYHAGDMAGAIMQQHKELIINERCLGLDHPDTAHSYGNMALFYHGLNQTELALRHMARTLLLLNVSSGPDHPDVAATFINIAMMYQDIGRMNIALRYLQEALQKNLRLLGEDHIQTAVCYHALAIAFNCIGAYKLSVQHEKSTYNILAKQLGEDDTRTRDSENWMKTFQLRDTQKGQQQSVAIKAADVLKARPDILQVFQAAAAASAGGGSRGSLKAAAAAAALMGDRENLPRSRGMDERGARAKADARKRAAARGVNVRVPNNLLPVNPDLLSIPTSGSGGKGREDGSLGSSSKAGKETKQTEASPTQKEQVKTDVETSRANAKPGNGSAIAEEKSKDGSAQEQAPLGLGVSLGSLESKKLKSLKKKAPSSKAVEL